MNSETQRIPSNTDEPKRVVERMADAIVEQMKSSGECRVAHLRALGFSLDDIARYWPDACKMAQKNRRGP